jgi:hypothetical protein
MHNIEKGSFELLVCEAALRLQHNWIVLMMEAVSTSKTSVNIYQTARRNIPEDSHLHNLRRENLKSHITEIRFFFMSMPA